MMTVENPLTGASTAVMTPDEIRVIAREIALALYGIAKARDVTFPGMIFPIEYVLGQVIAMSQANIDLQEPVSSAMPALMFGVREAVIPSAH